MPRTPAPLPPRPRPVLRVAFAGRRRLSGPERARLDERLRRLLALLGEALLALGAAARDHPPGARPTRVTDCYDPDRPPVLRLITGLCEGADHVAEQALAAVPAGLDRRLAAVLPFEPAAYRGSRDADFLAEFDRQAGACEYLLIADGCHDRTDDAADRRRRALADRRRAKGYRAQSALLLRQADLLIAAADPDTPGKAGGTLETLDAALALGLPVLFVQTDADHPSDPPATTSDPAGAAVASGVWLVREDRHGVLAGPSIAEAALPSAIDDLVRGLLAGPDAVPLDIAHGKARDEAMDLLDEFFQRPRSPPYRLDPDGRRQRRKGLREGVWGIVWGWLARRPARVGGAPAGRSADRDRGQPAPAAAAHAPADGPAPTPLGLWSDYRGRATALSYCHVGRYRGAFFVGYLLAVVAVLLAALGLALLATTDAHQPPAWLNPTLLGLGATKLLILLLLLKNVEQVNRARWNDRAVDYRYLAERLRAMFYLPWLGSFVPPGAAPPQHAERGPRQQVMDWLFGAIVRERGPADPPPPGDHGPWPWAPGEALVAAADATPVRLTATLLAPHPDAVLAMIDGRWLNEQIAYHERNARANGRLHRTTERLGRRLARLVVALVAVDLLVLAWHGAQLPPVALVDTAHGYTPWLLLAAAVLPAALAALNGLRFQSECRHLEKRSVTLAETLRARKREVAQLRARIAGATPCAAQAEADAEPSPGAWCIDGLRLAERIAADCAREVADWSVLYNRELPEV